MMEPIKLFMEKSAHERMFGGAPGASESSLSPTDYAKQVSETVRIQNAKADMFDELVAVLEGMLDRYANEGRSDAMHDRARAAIAKSVEIRKADAAQHAAEATEAELRG